MTILEFLFDKTDDGPSPKGGTESVLAVLREEAVPATFFIAGQGFDATWLDEDPKKQDVLRNIFFDGHQIGSHAWDHDTFLSKSIDEQRLDLQKLATLVRNFIGLNLTVFRAPFGEAKPDLVNLVENEFNYQIISWSIDTNDWLNRQDTEASLNNYNNEMKFSSYLNSSFIALHHDPLPSSGELARKAIRFMKSKGFKFVTVGQCIGIKDYAHLH